MEYIEIKNNIVVGHYCGEFPKNKKTEIEYRIIENCKVNIGDDVRSYSNLDKGILKPLKTLIAERLVAIPKGKKLNDDGTEFVDMTDTDRVKAGLIQLKPDEKVEGDYVVKKTKKELYDEGLITKEEFNLYIDEIRQAAYNREADPLGMQVLRNDLDKAVWLEKIEEIKKRHPKVE